MAWLEFIFIVGRLPLKGFLNLNLHETLKIHFSGGNFSIMFYNVSKTVFAYFGALACLDIGFSLAFMITHQCVETNPFLSYYRYRKLIILIARIISNYFIIVFSFFRVFSMVLGTYYELKFLNHQNYFQESLVITISRLILRLT